MIRRSQNRAEFMHAASLSVLRSNADVAKLADALDLGSKNARHATAPPDKA
jgi:hypothetical protein